MLLGGYECGAKEEEKTDDIIECTCGQSDSTDLSIEENGTVDNKDTIGEEIDSINLPRKENSNSNVCTEQPNLESSLE